MNKVTILFKDGTVAEQENVVNHSCTEKMFYFELDDGSQYYITIDDIRSVQVRRVENSNLNGVVMAHDEMINTLKGRGGRVNESSY